MFTRFLFGGFFALALLALLGKSLILLWAPHAFHNLTLGSQLWALLWGFRFDLAVTAMIWLPFALYAYLTARLGRRLSLLIIWAPAMILLGMQLADLMYFDNSGRHIGYEIKELLPEFKSLLNTTLTTYPVLFASFMAILALSGYLCRFSWPLPSRPTWRKLELPLLLWLIVGVFSVRGSATELPMKPDRAYVIGNNQQALLALNPAYNMISSLLAQEDASPVYLQAPQPDPNWFATQLEPYLAQHRGEYIPPTRQMNVILFMLESWPAELMRSYNPAADVVTPELDKLKKRGLSTDGLMAGGNRTVEGFYSALCSQPNPLGEGVPNTTLQSYDYHCLPAMLRDAGWEVAVFQGMHQGNTGQFTQQLGATASYGKLEMPDPTVEMNGWGYQDPDLYQFVLKHAKQATKPFFYIINNATTHDDQLPTGEPWVFGKEDMQASQKSVMHYADKALGEFIRAYEQSNPGPTLLLITADHTAGVSSGNMGRYWIPFTLFDTGGTIADQYKPGIGSQMDIAPTILDALGGRAPWFAGRSLLSHDPAGGGYFAYGTQGWVTGDRVIEYPLQDPTQLKCYHWRQDLPLRSPVACGEADQAMSQFSQSFTWYTQQLLFSGKTRLFSQPVDGVSKAHEQP